MKKKYLLLFAILFTSFSVGFAQTTFNYTGAMQTYTVPPCVYQLQVDVKGAQGNINANGINLGGLGGEVAGVLPVTPGQVLDIYVGGGGIKDTNGGFNGGGFAGVSDAQAQWSPSPRCPSADAGGGGGASDIRFAPYSLAARVVVAGGGGGTGGDRMVGCGPGAGGGGGGGYYGGGGGGGYSGLPGVGGSQVAGGAGGLSPGCSIFGGQAGSAGVFGIGGWGGFAPGNNQAGSAPGCQGGVGGTLVGGTGVNCTTGGCPGTWSGGSGGGGSNYAEPCMTGVVHTAGVQAGNGVVTVTPIGPCTGLTVTITQNPPTCGNCNGSITVTPAGGTPPYTYLWAPGGQTTATITGLCAGNYTVTVTDACGSTVTDTINFTSASLTVNATVNANEQCNGNCGGSITATVVGGVAPFTYAWTPSGGTNATATALCAGNYTITVTDVNGCSGTAAVSITQPPLLTATIVATNILCNGGNSTANVTVGGGTPGYTYLWAPGGNTNAVVTGLSAGNYTVTVTDNNGCTATASILIAQPPLLIATITAQTNVLCNGGNNGNATVTVGGGTPGYTYNWTPVGGAGSTGTGLTAGTYTVTVTDANGCTATASVTITQPPALTASITAQTNVLCNPGNNGSATVVAGGGTPGYNYVWTPIGGTNAIGTGLTAGSYTVTITDANGCTATAPVTITQPSPITTTVSFTPASCNLFNGSATVVAAGGTGPYTYLWNPGGNTNANATGLSANSYTVIVTDNNGCIATASIAVTQPPAVTATISSITNILCNGVNIGSATVSVAGGALPYTYLWNPGGQTTTTITGLSAGNYTITVTDNVGCISTVVATITEPPLLTATMGIPTNVSCKGGNNGSATVTVTGGTPAYVYNWTPNGGNGSTGIGLTVGTYTVTVTDANGCTATASVIITEPTLLTATITANTNVTCNGATNGTATVLGAGGTPFYSYVWSPNGGTNSLGTGLGAGTFTVTITDANSCTATATVTITQPTALATSLAPSNINCFGGNNGGIISTTTGGTVPYAYSWSNGETTANATTLVAGSYTLTVTDANGCTATASANITSPTRLTITASGPQSDCSGAQITLNSSASGGTPPYAYNWTPAGGTTAITNVNPAVTTTYTVTVTDMNGCTAQATVSVIVGPPLTLSVSGNTSVCPGGTINLISKASGGDGNYTYTWLPSNLHASGITFNPSGNTTVTITVTDGCGSAPVTLIIPITVNPPPAISFTSDVLKGCSPLCVQFRNLTTITSGGVNQFTWNFGNNDTTHSQSPIYCYKDTGFASVTLTAISDSGCSSTLTVINMVQVYPSPNANFTYSPQPINILSPSVQFNDLSTGKYRIAEWYWTFGDGTKSNSTLQNPQHQYGDTGMFCASLVVVDMHGCVDSITNCLVVNPLFTFYIPNAFSPNDDGINDVFMPKGSYVKDYEMYIFDRWGMKLFYTNDFNTGWVGRVNNGSQVCQEDTYVYLINVTDTQGNKHSYTGKLSLLK